MLQAELRAQQQAVAERDQHAQDLLDVIHQQVRASEENRCGSLLGIHCIWLSFNMHAQAKVGACIVHAGTKAANGLAQSPFVH
jgi:hypothetical protein